jgi:hypothetical protein
LAKTAPQSLHGSRHRQASWDAHRVLALKKLPACRLPAPQSWLALKGSTSPKQVVSKLHRLRSKRASKSAQAAENRAAQQQQLQALGFSAEQAQQMVGLGGQERAASIQDAQLLESIGKSQRAFEQEGLDINYQDFLRQQAFPEQQLQFMSSILRGVPVQPSVTQTAYAPFNPMQQLAGAGLAGIGLYRGMQ